MKRITLSIFRGAPGRSGSFLSSLALLLLAASALQAQTQPISPDAGLPTLTFSFNHTQVVTIAQTAYDFNYYDFNITGFTNVGQNNPDYDIFSFSNSTLEKMPTVVAVAPAYLPEGWTFDDSQDFLISTGLRRAIHADDPAFGLIFIQTLGSDPINPGGAPFQIFHEENGQDPFTLNGKPVVIRVSPVPEASTNASLGLLMLGLGGLAMAARRKKTVKA